MAGENEKGICDFTERMDDAYYTILFGMWGLELYEGARLLTISNLFQGFYCLVEVFNDKSPPKNMRHTQHMQKTRNKHETNTKSCRAICDFGV